MVGSVPLQVASILGLRGPVVVGRERCGGGGVAGGRGWGAWLSRTVAGGRLVRRGPRRPSASAVRVGGWHRPRRPGGAPWRQDRPSASAGWRAPRAIRRLTAPEPRPDGSSSAPDRPSSVCWRAPSAIRRVTALRSAPGGASSVRWPSVVARRRPRGRGMGRRRVHATRPATRPAPRPHPCRHPARVPCYTWCSRISISLEPRVPTNPGFNLCRPRSRRPRSRRPAGLRRAASRDAPTDGDPPPSL